MQPYPPTHVYHYASMNSFLKIIESRSLWATSVKYLNDISEFGYFLDEISQRIPELSRKHSDLSGYLPDLVHNPKANFRDLPFTASFAAAGDSLTHWRSYCPNGNGVSIAFRSVCLKQTQGQNPETALPGTIVIDVQYGQVLYLKKKDLVSIDALLETFLEQCRRQLAERPYLSEIGVTPLDLFASMVGGQASLTKSHRFRSEREYRLVVNNIKYRNDLLRFRAVRSSLVPYVALRIPNTDGSVDKAPWNAIDKVTIGPSPNMKLTAEAVSAFLDTHGIYADVVKSRVPYRDW